MADRVVEREITDTGPTVGPATTGAVIIARIIWFVAGVILILLAFRFVLALLGANPNNAFANFIFDTSHPFVAPFFNLFSYNEITTGASRVEFFTLFAMAVYAAIAWGLSYLATIGSRNRDVV